MSDGNTEHGKSASNFGRYMFFLWKKCFLNWKASCQKIWVLLI